MSGNVPACKRSIDIHGTQDGRRRLDMTRRQTWQVRALTPAQPFRRLLGTRRLFRKTG
jgi:hypothetical protein